MDKNTGQMMGGQQLSIQPEQCAVQVAPDASCVYLYALGQQPTGWRSRPDEPWNWLQPGQSQALYHHWKITLDYNYPEQAVYKLAEGKQASTAGPCSPLTPHESARAPLPAGKGIVPQNHSYTPFPLTTNPNPNPNPNPGEHRRPVLGLRLAVPGRPAGRPAARRTAAGRPAGLRPAAAGRAAGLWTAAAGRPAAGRLRRWLLI